MEDRARGYWWQRGSPRYLEARLQGALPRPGLTDTCDGDCDARGGVHELIIDAGRAADFLLSVRLSRRSSSVLPRVSARNNGQ